MCLVQFHVYSVSIRLGSVIDYIVEGTRRYSSNLLQGGIEIPCESILKGHYKNLQSSQLGCLKVGSLIKYLINKQKTVARKRSQMAQILQNPQTHFSADIRYSYCDITNTKYLAHFFQDTFPLLFVYSALCDIQKTF